MCKAKRLFLLRMLLYIRVLHSTTNGFCTSSNADVESMKITKEEKCKLGLMLNKGLKRWSFRTQQVVNVVVTTEITSLCSLNM